MSNKPNLMTLLIAAMMANAAKVAQDEDAPLPDLDAILSGARQKGTPIFNAKLDPDMAAAAQRMDAEVAAFRSAQKRPTAPEILRKGADTYEERNSLYGDSYKVYGAVMKAMFPDGLPDFATVADFNRLGVFSMIVSKIMRYASNIGNGGHFDSALDLSVYAAMLAELTEEEGK